jgi:hypothetical protein
MHGSRADRFCPRQVLEGAILGEWTPGEAILPAGKFTPPPSQGSQVTPAGRPAADRVQLASLRVVGGNRDIQDEPLRSRLSLDVTTSRLIATKRAGSPKPPAPGAPSCP